MTYKEATEWLFNQIPNYQNTGGNAYKPGLDRISGFLNSIGNPQNKIKTVHVAGTNGKGSVCHMIAAALQANNYKVGIFSSPHVFDFTERIKINGDFVSEEFVTEFIKEYKEVFLKFNLSFFEITAAMAFEYFALKKVDIALIETGLGGRLDATNVVNPVLSVITKIGIDHTEFLGNTITEIAGEKAGIIKKDKPIVLGDLNPEVIKVVVKKANATDSEIYQVDKLPQYHTSLGGSYQTENLKTAEKAIDVLSRIGFRTDNLKTELGLLNVQKLTKFFGRFQVTGKDARVIVDVAHNKDGIRELLSEVSQIKESTFHIVFGGAKDKDLNSVFEQFASFKAKYYLTEFSSQRTSKMSVLENYGKEYNLEFNAYSNAVEAFEEAKKNSKSSDYVVVCGSFFLLSDLKSLREYIFQ